MKTLEQFKQSLGFTDENPKHNFNIITTTRNNNHVIWVTPSDTATREAVHYVIVVTPPGLRHS